MFQGFALKVTLDYYVQDFAMANIVIYSEDVLGQAMAGPAIRCWEFAKELSKAHSVAIIAPKHTTLTHPSFPIYTKKSPKAQQAIREAEVIITQQITPQLSYQAKKNGTALILDAYCPVTLEILEQLHHIPSEKKELYIQRSIHSQRFSFQMADGIICASEKQKDFWLGLLASLPELHRHHKKNSTLDHFLQVVPYGLSSTEVPPKNGPGPRELFSLAPSDKLLIWGGSISDWFDPCTLVKAVKKISESRSDVKLVFMGVKHPNDKVPEMSVVGKAIALAKELEIDNRFVFFNTQWIPYDQRHNFLSEAAIGVSIHSHHLETRFSFRTRILDYLWAGLPIVSTEGDSFANLVEKERLGFVVPYHNSDAISQAILTILNNPDLSAQMKDNVLALSKEFRWERVMDPLKTMISHCLAQPRSSDLSPKNIFEIGKALWKYYQFTFKILGKRQTAQKVFERLKHKSFKKSC